MQAFDLFPFGFDLLRLGSVLPSATSLAPVYLNLCVRVYETAFRPEMSCRPHLSADAATISTGSRCWQLHRDYKRTLPTGRQAPPIPHPGWTLTGLAVYCPVSSNIYYASGALLFHTFLPYRCIWRPSGSQQSCGFYSPILPPTIPGDYLARTFTGHAGLSA